MYVVHVYTRTDRHTPTLYTLHSLDNILVHSPLTPTFLYLSLETSVVSVTFFPVPVVKTTDAVVDSVYQTIQNDKRCVFWE